MSLSMSSAAASHLWVRWRQTDGSDQLVHLYPLAQPQQGDVIVVGVGLEVRMEDDQVHRAAGGHVFVLDSVESEEHLKDRNSET